MNHSPSTRFPTVTGHRAPGAFPVPGPRGESKHHRRVVKDRPRGKLETSLFIVKSSKEWRKLSKCKKTSSNSKTDDSPNRNEGKETARQGSQTPLGVHGTAGHRPSKGVSAPVHKPMMLHVRDDRPPAGKKRPLCPCMVFY